MTFQLLSSYAFWITLYLIGLIASTWSLLKTLYQEKQDEIDKHSPDEITRIIANMDVPSVLDASFRDNVVKYFIIKPLVIMLACFVVFFFAVISPGSFD